MAERLRRTQKAAERGGGEEAGETDARGTLIRIILFFVFRIADWFFKIAKKTENHGKLRKNINYIFKIAGGG